MRGMEVQRKFCSFLCVGVKERNGGVQRRRRLWGVGDGEERLDKGRSDPKTEKKLC